MQAERLRDARGEPLAGPLLLTPQVFRDARGFFLESWNERRFAAALIEGGWPEEEAGAIRFRQDNHSRSQKGVLRGLHYQLEPEPQGKLVRCSAGAIFDVAVDLRRSSAGFGRWGGVVLDAVDHRQLWVPVGFAHGFLTLTDTAEVQYKASGFWNRGCERALRWNDPDLAIAWPLDRLGIDPDSGAPAGPQLAARDGAAPTLAEAIAAGEVFP